jgi:hypothetical protein
LVQKKSDRKAIGLGGGLKGQMTEREAVIWVNQHIITSAVHVWPRFFRSMQTFANLSLQVLDDEQATFDLALAAMALELQAVKNLFPKDQAERITTFAYEQGHSAKYGDYAFQELKRYIGAYEAELQLIGTDGKPLIKDYLFAQDYSSGSLDLNRYLIRSARFWNDAFMIPVGVVCALLLHRWLGEDVTNYEAKLEEKGAGVLDPVLLDSVIEILCAPPFVGTWKYVKDTFLLIDG